MTGRCFLTVFSSGKGVSRSRGLGGVEEIFPGPTRGGKMGWIEPLLPATALSPVLALGTSFGLSGGTFRGSGLGVRGSGLGPG